MTFPITMNLAVVLGAITLAQGLQVFFRRKVGGPSSRAASRDQGHAHGHNDTQIRAPAAGPTQCLEISCDPKGVEPSAAEQDDAGRRMRGLQVAPRRARAGSPRASSVAVTLARRSEAVCLCVGLALAVAPVSAQTPERGGAAAQESEDLLGGFDDEQEDDPLSGFGDEFEPAFEVETDEPEEKPIWNLSGSAEISSSINYIAHRSSVGTSYTGVSRLRMRLNLELDVELPRDWEMRAAGYVFYDPIFAIHGRDQYTAEVLDLYAWEVDSLDVYVQGSLTDDLDLKLGRQVVIWGRSDTIRILDVLNPLDQREPGRVDIEELRRPVTMARFDYYVEQWNLAAILIPEIRFDLDPA